jgi:hypothetical protein
MADERKKAAELDGPVRIDLIGNLRKALAAGKSLSGLLREVYSLSRGPGRLTPHEYFYYQLDNCALPFEEKKRFIGKAAQTRFHFNCNDARWFAIIHDKLLFQAAMEGAGFPVPRLLAVQHNKRSWPKVPHLATNENIACFFETNVQLPMFVKPIDGMYSLGSMLVEGYAPASSELLLRFRGRLAIDSFAQLLLTRESGHIFQECLEPHPDIATLIGNRLPSVRVIVFLSQNDPVIFRAVCKLPMGINIADNYWRDGNMLGAIAMDTGEIKRVVRGTGSDLVEIERHPDTGEKLIGYSLPGWPKVRELVGAAARTLPGVRTQAWDVALSSQGPVLLEVNFGGDLNLAQLAFGAGALDENYVAHLRSCGYRKRLLGQRIIRA